jgi:hypothetical protein
MQSLAEHALEELWEQGSIHLLVGLLRFRFRELGTRTGISVNPTRHVVRQSSEIRRMKGDSLLVREDLERVL